MHYRSLLFALFFFLSGFLVTAFGQEPVPAGNTQLSNDLANDPIVRRAQAEVDKIQGLVSTGVLPRARLDEAKASLADIQDDAVIRNSLYQKDITVDQADAMVDLTAKRVVRRQKIMEDRYKLLSAGIIAQSELGSAVEALGQAKREHTWAETRARLARELVELAKNEQDVMRQLELSGKTNGGGMVQHFVGSNRFNMGQFTSIDRAFEIRFAHPLPVSAMGETEVHKSLGYDHRNRVDVALQPDQPEGLWLRHYLTAHNIPFFAFRSAVARKATGAHIHIGPPSLHYLVQTPHVINGED
jgi:hypothetical protein